MSDVYIRLHKIVFVMTAVAIMLVGRVTITYIAYRMPWQNL